MEASKEFKQAWREKRKQIKCPEKGASNDHFRSKYRSWEDTEKALSDAGLDFYFELHNTPDQAGVSWIVELNDEEATVATCMVDKAKRDPQATGGCYTYAMRYAVQVHLGWGMPDVDDDGNDASGIVSPEQEVEILGGVFAMQKTQEGLQNCWAENDDVVMRMHQGHPDLYEQIVKHYQNAQKKLTEV
ncbi:MAG: hypothetical protein CML17_12460 [Pusillimonas sp.]|nr:hypothetical protein [Pusillimonas sp.]